MNFIVSSSSFPMAEKLPLPYANNLYIGQKIQNEYLTNRLDRASAKIGLIFALTNVMQFF